MVSGVACIASYVLAAAIATLCAGSVTPASFGAQDRLPGSVAAPSPESRLPEASGAMNGERQPGDATSGIDCDRLASIASWLVHDCCCEPAKTPSLCQPMLMLVPIDTKR